MTDPDSNQALKDEEELLLGHIETAYSTTIQPGARPRYFGSYQKAASILKDVILLALAIPTLMTLYQHISGQAQPAAVEHVRVASLVPSCSCGKSVAEAISLDCKYDTLAAAWLPPHCRDEELTALFDRSGNGPNGTWTYWADLSHKTEISEENISALADQPGDGTFYATHRWHLVHCLFYWRKSIRAASLGVRVEGRYNTEKHMIHCTKMLDADSSRGSFSAVALNNNRFLGYRA